VAVCSGSCASLCICENIPWSLAEIVFYSIMCIAYLITCLMKVLLLFDIATGVDELTLEEFHKAVK